MVGCVRKLNHIRYDPKTIQSRSMKNYDPNNMKRQLLSCNWNNVYGETDVNRSWGIMKYFLRDCIDNMIPITMKKVRGKSCPWLTGEIKRKINDRNLLLRNCRKSKLEEDVAAYRKLRNQVNVLVRKAKRDFHKNVLKENEKQPDKFWESIKKLYPTKRKTTISPSFDSDQTDSGTINVPQTVANAFNSFFAKVVKRLKEASIPLCNLTWKRHTATKHRTVKRFRFCLVAVKEVEKHLKALKRKKAEELDSIPSFVLKDCAKVIANPLYHQHFTRLGK